MQLISLAFAALLGIAQAVDVQVVSVGKDPQTNTTGLKYWPETIKAAPGSVVHFQFLAGNHTVTQSDFSHPCRPIAPVDGSKHGISSGFVPVTAGGSNAQVPTFSVSINDTKPIWIYCAQGPHCELGMVMVINQNTTANPAHTLSNYKAAAAALAKKSSSPTSSAPKASHSCTATSVHPGSPAASTGTAGRPSSTPSAVPVSGAPGLVISSSLLVGFAALFLAFVLEMGLSGFV